MSFTEEKRDSVKKYIFYKISEDDPDFISKAQEIAGSSITTIKNYLKEVVLLNQIVPSNKAKCGYEPVTIRHEFSCSIDEYTDENVIYADFVSPILDNEAGLGANARHIIDYAFLEMVNNAIEHSQGKNINISIITDPVNVSVVIKDDGLGIFKVIEEYFAENGARVDSLTELYKGKITTKSENHSGEGIFFTSRMVSEFGIISDNRVLSGGVNQIYKLKSSHLVSYFTSFNKIGTMVVFRVNKDMKVSTKEVFNKYSNEDGFNVTHIPVSLICGSLGPLSRSQARQICYRLEEFNEAIIDFDGVDDMGQGFSDEIFRVYATAHPDIKLRPTNANIDVIRMIKHVGRGNLCSNVILPK